MFKVLLWSFLCISQICQAVEQYLLCWNVKEYLQCIVKVELISVQQSISVLPLIRALWLFTVRHRNGTLEIEASSFSLSATLQDFSSKCS